MSCKNCNNDLKAEAVYCNNCGTKNRPSEIDELEDNESDLCLDLGDGTQIPFIMDLGHGSKMYLTGMGPCSERANYYFSLAIEAIERDELYEALEYITRSIELFELDELNINYQPYYYRGKIYRWLKQNDKAVSDQKKVVCEFAEALSKDEASDLVFFFNNLGIEAGKNQKYQDAIEYYTLAIRVGPEEIGVIYNRGTIYEFLGQYDLALKDYTKVLELSNKDEDVIMRKVDILIYQGKLNEAKETILSGLSFDPENQEFLIRKVRIDSISSIRESQI